MPVIKEIKIDKSKTKGGGHVAQVEPKSTDVKVNYFFYNVISNMQMFYFYSMRSEKRK